ncbi:CHASE2 domain-containing protein [Komarekiella sp. 'clone 1']|uniref:histidine kinase n=1 Tax=Komarekiella delphini-convector SJRDD-AB1 TaxID=2593771 RepID=A0AA40VTD7_9NOST|nr:CHASE2 domain-containing protein [Komarekiella delphini-convector]MBD6619094.1 CHASE2 domain-containing protein [Komarekiella delphini-convector SJRDD-AB1]
MWRRGWQIKFLSLGIGCGVFYNFIFSQIPLVQKLELQLQDTLLRLHYPKSPPKEIILVKIQRKDLANQMLSLGRVFYADLVKHLLEAGASVVVLNLRNDWREPPEFDYPIKITEPINRPLKNLVQNHSNRLVLVTRTNPISNIKKQNFLIYNHLIPFDGEQFQPLIPPHTIQGFFEYEPEAEFSRNLSSTARRSHLVGQFFISHGSNQVETFKSAALLALEKFEQQEKKVYLSSKFTQVPHQVKINFWGKAGTFPSLELTSICQPSKDKKCLVVSGSQLSQKVGRKVVLIGFAEGNNIHTMAMLSPKGDSMAGVEIQANLIASLMTDSFLQIPPQWVELIIIIFGAVLFTVGIYRYQKWHLLCLFLVLFGSYFGGCLILWKCKWILSIILPLFVWVATGVSIFIYFIFGQQKEIITLQNYQITQLKAAEQEAILSRTRKILHRIASDIHDGALQDLKLVMDKIELEPDLDVDLILEKLTALGQEIREKLSNIRVLAGKMEVTLALREGLDVGISTTLQDLVKSGKLTLTVIKELQPLQEPELNSVWIEHREEIYRFFREALNNVIQHAQPPHGTATQVCISLGQQGVRCTLAIANDASIVESTTYGRKKGGYGTKMMDAIAAELPDGAWQMLALPDGQVRVTLSWRLP